LPSLWEFVAPAHHASYLSWRRTAPGSKPGQEPDGGGPAGSCRVRRAARGGPLAAVAGEAVSSEPRAQSAAQRRSPWTPPITTN
jgi:hypothetical protein